MATPAQMEDHMVASIIELGDQWKDASSFEEDLANIVFDTNTLALLFTLDIDNIELPLVDEKVQVR